MGYFCNINPSKNQNQITIQLTVLNTAVIGMDSFLPSLVNFFSKLSIIKPTTFPVLLFLTKKSSLISSETAFIGLPTEVSRISPSLS